MAGDDNRQRVPIVRHAHGAKTLRAAYRTRNVTVAASLSVGNRQQRSPTRDLKICSSQINLEVELSPFPCKILLQLLGVRLQGVRRFLKANRRASPRFVFRPQITWVGTNGLLARKARIKLQRYQTAFGSSQKQRTYWGHNRRGMKSFHKKPPAATCWLS
jgi:hypothetical protein